jgi:hypothetical protein
MLCLMSMFIRYRSYHGDYTDHLGRAKWASSKHDEVGLTWAWSGTKDSGPCPGLASDPLCLAQHDPFGRTRLGPMVGPISPAQPDKKWDKIVLLHYLV